MGRPRRRCYCSVLRGDARRPRRPQLSVQRRVFSPTQREFLFGFLGRWEVKRNGQKVQSLFSRWARRMMSSYEDMVRAGFGAASAGALWLLSCGGAEVLCLVPR